MIAQTPVEPRDHSRLLVMALAGGELRPAHFFQLGEFLRPGDLLVLNETRVIPARVFARKAPCGGRVELLLLRRLDALTWEALAGGKRVRPGLQLVLEDGPQGVVLEALDGARRVIRFEASIDAYLQQAGQMPLPPYIHTPLQNPDRYQTVYARTPGSAAAPTAGLHFTPHLMETLQAQGVRFAGVTLHVGLDTFAPVTEEAPEEHHIHTEWCELDATTAAAINSTHQAGGRVIAVGTTSVRTLESAAQAAALEGRRIAPFRGPTGLYILPGYSFQLVDGIITNFHLPRSTLIMLVSAFAGRERILAAYDYARREGFRFYSFGDAMLIV